MMAQEIRSAGSDANGAGVERLVVCAADTLRIQSDLDSDGLIEGAVEPAEDVTWFYDPGGERLLRNTAGGTMTEKQEIPAPPVLVEAAGCFGADVGVGAIRADVAPG